MQYEHILKDIEHEYSKYLEAFNPVMKKYLDLTVSTILEYVKNSVVAIYLIGSFGRGEGALYVERGHVEPLRDFDVLVVTMKPIKSDIIIAMTEEIHNKLGIPSPTKTFLEEFSVWITYTLLNDLVKGIPLLKYFELKHSSMRLYGIDIRPLIDLELKDVSLYNGILILLTKIEGLLALYPLPGTRNFKRRLNFIYEVLKMYTEFSTVFSLIDNSIYRPRYPDRCYNFVKVYREKAPWLFRLIPDLDYYVTFACVKRRLLTKDFITALDIYSITFQAIEALDKVLSLYITLGYNIKVPLSGFSNSNKKMLDKVSLVSLANFFNDYLRKVFKIRNRTVGRILSIGITPFYLLTSNIKFILKARKSGIPVRVRLMFSIKNNFVYLAYIGLVTLKTIVHGEHNKLAMIFKYLEEYLDGEYINILRRGVTDTARLDIVIKLLTKLLRLADVSLHGKTF